MRDPFRIYPFACDLAEFWQHYMPDLRFAQVFEVLKMYHPTLNGDFCFNWEEEDWQAAMKEYVKRHPLQG